MQIAETVGAFGGLPREFTTNSCVHRRCFRLSFISSFMVEVSMKIAPPSFKNDIFMQSDIKSSDCAADVMLLNENPGKL